MVEAGSTQPLSAAETPAKPKRREAAFDMAEILRDKICRPIGWIEHIEELGRIHNPDGKKLPLTIERVNKMMRGKYMP